VTYPILVVDFDADHPADVVICTTCEEEDTWVVQVGGDPSDDRDLRHASCDGRIVFKFQRVAGKCPGCGKVFATITRSHGGACSRVCALQAEYAHWLGDMA
jgi:hypothetical protein